MDKFSPEERLNYLYAYTRFDNEPLKLDFWQEDFVKSTKQFICILKSRRTGFSFATALKGLSYALDPGRQKYVKQFVSYNESDALEKIRYAREFYDGIPKWARKKIVTENKSELEFLDANGKTTSRLISMPCRPPRGKGGSISLDEFGIFLPKMSRMVYTAALYVISRGGNIEVGSTPLGCIGQFYEICTDRKTYPGYQRFSVPWWFSKALCTDVASAVREAPRLDTEERVARFASDTLKQIFANSILEDFQQECECVFVDTAESYITLEEIYANTPGMEQDFSAEEDTELLPSGAYDDFLNRDLVYSKTVDDMCLRQYDPDRDGILYLGYDVAKNRDAASIFVLGLLPDGRKKVYGYEELRAKTFDFQQDCIHRIMKSLPVKRMCIDSTGMGAPIAEALSKKYRERVEGIDFSIATKEEMAMGIKIGLQQKRFILPNEKNLQNQIHSIKRKPSTGGHFRYDADRDENGHADSFWSFALANLAAGTEKKTGFYVQKAESNKMMNVREQEESVKPEEEKKIIRKGKGLNSLNRKMYEGW